MKIIINIIIKEFLQLKRDPRLFGIVFLAPVLQLIFLGYAANMDVDVVHTVIFDQDRSVASHNFIKKFQSSGYFAIDKYVDGYEELTELIDEGLALAALVIPINFEKKIYRHESVPVQVILDGSDGNKSAIALGYIQRITSGFSNNILMDMSNVSGGEISSAGSLIPEMRIWYNPDLKSRVFMVPSIMGLILMVITTILMSMAIVKEREVGTLEQLIVTPIKPYQLIVGKLIPFVILGFIDILIVTTIMIYWFDIGIRGSFALLLFSSFLFVLSTLGVGLFISTISRTQQQAMMIAQFGIMMPMIYLSGFAFPIENMPIFVQYITYFIPLRYFITILRGIVLKGAGIAELVPELLMLLFMGTAILFASALRFKKRLE